MKLNISTTMKHDVLHKPLLDSKMELPIVRKISQMHPPCEPLVEEDDLKERVEKQVKILWDRMTIKLKREDATPTEIVPNLYIGSIGAAYNRDNLEAWNITHILICARYLDPLYPSVFKYQKVPIMDTLEEDLNPHLDSAHSFIDEALQQGSGILVHCFKGQSRSASVIISYLIWKQGLTYKEAIDITQSKRKKV